MTHSCIHLWNLPLKIILKWHIPPPLSRAHEKLVEVVSLFTQFHVGGNLISIASFMSISLSSLILVLNNQINQNRPFQELRIALLKHDW